ncbi:MAG: hypothetical protein ACI8TP_000324 [Acidimicrobiales bacterium]|jgi:hypothetical protein
MSARHEIADRMAAAATELLDCLGADQRNAVSFASPQLVEGETTERRRWFYTPTDHGGLPLADMTSRQQRFTHRLVASGLSTAGYVTMATIIGLENVLDHTEGWTAGFARERGRDPQLYWIAVFGAPADRVWGWRFGGHHVSLHYTVIDGEVVATTPSFFGADPASSPLLGPHLHRPLAAAEDLGRELVNTLDPSQLRKALLTRRAPIDIVTANRTLLADGDNVVPLPEVFRGRLPEPVHDLMVNAQLTADAKAALTGDDRTALAFRLSPSGVPVAGLKSAQTDVLRSLLDAYLDRLPDGLADLEKAKLSGDAINRLSFSWAGGLAAGQPHYYRIQSRDLLVEYDNTQRDVNHVHTVWRDLTNDFGGDSLSAHYADRHHS